MSTCLISWLLSLTILSGAVQSTTLAPQTTLGDSLAIPATDDGLPGSGPIRRYDWFQKLWLQKRTQFAKEQQTKQNAVVFLGDSITQGWGDSFQGHFEGVLLANRGISGDTTRGMLIRLKEDVLSLNPSAVVLLMGTNDLEEDARPATIAANFKLIIDALCQHNSEMPIIVCNVFPSSETKKRSAADIRQINTLYAAAVRGNPQVSVLDTWTLFADEDGDARVAEFPDLLHPNAAGYQKWAAALRPMFATYGIVDTEADTFEPEAGFKSLFNGRDLTGWEYRPTSKDMLDARSRWQKNNPNAPPWPIVTERAVFDGLNSSPDGRYRVVNGRLVVTTPPEGRSIQQLWTTQEFDDDFTLKLQFRATPNADSGVFIRKPQLQCRDYVLAGPYRQLTAYRPQQWNDLTIVVKGGVAHCSCNGEVIEAEFEVPESGPIGLEGDRGQMEYRRIRIRSN
jgi:lysophospholipase L1-like esterase